MIISESYILRIKEYLKLVYIFECLNGINHVLNMYGISVFTILESRCVDDLQQVLTLELMILTHLDRRNLDVRLGGARSESR